MISTIEKEKIVSKHKLHEKDTGSAEVQVGLLSEEIEMLLAHLQKHKKDFHSKKGLLKMVAKRRRLLKYLEKANPKKHKEIIKKIGLKS
jgi:small subunit ribosomal protein S15